MAYAGYNVLNFGGYSPGGSPTGAARSPGFSSPFLNNPSQGQQGYNPNWDPINWNPNLANAMKWLGYSPAQERQSIISPYQTPGGSFSGTSAPPTTTPTTPSAPTTPTNPVTTAPAPTTPPNNSNDYWSTIHPILGGPIGTGATSSGVTPTTSSGNRVPGGVGGVIDYTQPARTTPGGPIGSQSTPWTQPTNWFGKSAFPSSPPDPPAGKLNFQDWYNRIGKNMPQSVSFGSPAASYLDYIGYTGSGGTAPPATTNPSTSPGTTTSPTTTAAPGPSPNSDFLGALQTAIDSLGNLAPNVSPINPNPSTDYSFNANAPSDVANNWSSYVNMLGYNRT